MRERKTTKQLLLETVKRGETNSTDVKKLLEFIQYYSITEKLTSTSVQKYYYTIKPFLRAIKKRSKTIDTLQEQDVLALLELVHTSKWSEDSRADYWDRFTRFWSWAADRAADNGEEWDRRAYRLLADPKHKKPYKMDKNKRGKKGIISPEEVLQLVDIEGHPAYKAFFSILYETGMRAGEALSLLLEDVETHDNGTFTLHIRASKTEKRPVPVRNGAAKHLNKWLRIHPRDTKSENKLFLNTLGRPLNHFAANKELKLLLRLCGIKTAKLSMHSFRHSRATELAGRGLTEFQMCRLFGWRIGSKMPATYIRSANIDVTQALDRIDGKENYTPPKPAGVYCRNCGWHNPEVATLCDNCNLPLDEEQQAQIRRNSDNAQLLNDLLEQRLRALEERLGSVVLSEMRQLAKQE